jgi:N-acetylglucosaminyl-diphospho-decaprenol L-rhamnosyltransferase
LRPDLSIIIVSYNTSALLRSCLTSIAGEQAATNAQAPDVPRPITIETIVVDNDSRDDSRAMVRSEFSDVTLIESDNVGFAAGSNKGMRAAGGRYVLLLNPDTEVQGDALAMMVHFLDDHPSAGLAGARLLNPDGSFQHSAFRFPTLLMTFLDFFPLNHRLLNGRLNGRYPAGAYAAPFAIDHPLGACMMVRRDVIDKVGILDEDFFMYCEEIDWCLRIKRAGWQIWYTGAPVVHHGAQSTRQFRHRMFVELFRSRYLLFRKHYPAYAVWANRQIVRLGLGREMLRAWYQHRRGRIEDDDYAARMDAYRQVWRF